MQELGHLDYTAARAVQRRVWQELLDRAACCDQPRVWHVGQCVLKLSRQATPAYAGMTEVTLRP